MVAIREVAVGTLGPGAVILGKAALEVGAGAEAEAQAGTEGLELVVNPDPGRVLAQILELAQEKILAQDQQAQDQALALGRT